MPETKTARVRGVIASLRVLDGQVVLLLQDGEADAEHSAQWQVARLYTQREFSTRAFNDLKPSDYRQIGFNLVNRLRAISAADLRRRAPGSKRRDS